MEIEILDDDIELNKRKAQFEEKMSVALEEETKQYTSLDINWVAEEESYESIKTKTLDLLNKSKHDNPKDSRLFFLAHTKDKIQGKPQLVDSIKKNIVMLHKCQKETNKGEIITQYKFLGDPYDRRMDGREINSLVFDFWMYYVDDSDGNRHYLLSKYLLPLERCEFQGMKILVNDSAELSRSMKLKSISNIFLVYDFEPLVKIISKEQLIEYTKERKISLQDWDDFLAYHPMGNYNRFPYHPTRLKSAWLLSGKADGYPLHLLIQGKPGTRKTFGWIESLAYKFDEDTKICEGANSRIKGLSPSFKEKPANPGFLANSNRIGFIDEESKMVEREMKTHEGGVDNVLGEINFLLEHKKRTVTSGNDNSCEVKATAKFLFLSNPIGKKETIHQHIGLIDPTTMSRRLNWVQDYEETNFVMKPESIEKIPPTPTLISISPPKISRDLPPTPQHIYKSLSLGGSGNEGPCWTKIRTREEFLTLFDSCFNFCSEIEDLKVQEIVSKTLLYAKEPMKSSVWKPRCLHHTKLLIDGLCKERCLFKDYDPSFTAKEEDYRLAEQLLMRMVKSWDTNFRIDAYANEFSELSKEKV